jgi:signal transduction histidine kinase
VQERTVSLQSSVAELEAFGHDVAHTLRAPLRAMDGMAEVVLDEHGAALPADVREHLGRISDAARTMDARITALLEYSRLGRRHVERRAVDVRALLGRAIDHATRRHARRDDRVTIEADETRPALADPTLLTRALQEVVANALVHRRGEAPVHVRVRLERHGTFARVAIQDDGPGIDPRHQDRIFGMFERLHSDNALGLGGGLAIAQRAVTRMGGRVTLESQPGVGSTFWIEVPAVTAWRDTVAVDRSARAEAPAPADAARPAQGAHAHLDETPGATESLSRSSPAPAAAVRRHPRS